MDKKKYKLLWLVVTLYIIVILALAIVQHSTLLLISGAFTGLLFITLVRSKAIVQVDERETTVREKAAQVSYTIFAPTIAIGALLLAIFGGEFYYLEALGMVFVYLTLFLIIIYAISYFYLNHRFGGSDEK